MTALATAELGFDQTLSVDDSGFALSELLGITNFQEIQSIVRVPVGYGKELHHRRLASAAHRPDRETHDHQRRRPQRAGAGPRGDRRLGAEPDPPPVRVARVPYRGVGSSANRLADYSRWRGGDDEPAGGRRPDLSLGSLT